MNLRSVAVAWNIMWGLSYIAVAIIAPWISDDTISSVILYVVLGLAILIAVLLVHSDKTPLTIGRIMFSIFATIEVASGIASWTGVATWNVRFEAKELFNVSMAFADLLSAVFMLLLAIEEPKP